MLGFFQRMRAAIEAWYDGLTPEERQEVMINLTKHQL